MKKIFWTIIGAALLVGCSGVSEKQTPAADENVVYETILARTSVRQFTNEAVSAGKVDSLLRAGMAAPTAVNKQPWQFIVVNEREILDSIGSMAGAWAPIGRAQVGIIVCGDLEKALPGEMSDFWIHDCSAVSENILIAAKSMGLGSVWCGCYPHADRVAQLREYFQLPESIIPLNVIAIGYPAENPTPKEKFNPNVIHYNGWNN